MRDKVDENGDGVLTLDEFVTTLKPPMQERMAYKAIVGDEIKVDNPLELEARILDLQY